jgi:biopolymer transport protein ExbB
LSQGNRVFETLSGFRAAARRVQSWLVRLGLLGAALAALGALQGLVPAWTIPAAVSLVPLSWAWGLLWRRRVERAFWEDARVPRRGQRVRLPLEVLLVTLAAGLAGSGRALAADSRLVVRIGELRGLDLEALVTAAGIGGWIALGLGLVALLVALYLFFSLWSGHFAPRALRAELLEKITGGDLDAARALCQSGPSLLARSVLAGLPAAGRPAGAAEHLPAARIEATGRRGAARWRALVDLLAAAGLLPPVAGVFGTVLGLIDVFAASAGEGYSAAWVAAGAVTALVPAAVSLAVSLFALGAYYLTDLRLGSLTAKCEAACMECAAALEDLGADVRARSGLTTVALARDGGQAGEGA